MSRGKVWKAVVCIVCAIVLVLSGVSMAFAKTEPNMYGRDRASFGGITYVDTRQKMIDVTKDSKYVSLFVNPEGISPDNCVVIGQSGFRETWVSSEGAAMINTAITYHKIMRWWDFESKNQDGAYLELKFPGIVSGVVQDQANLLEYANTLEEIVKPPDGPQYKYYDNLDLIVTFTNWDCSGGDAGPNPWDGTKGNPAVGIGKPGTGGHKDEGDNGGCLFLSSSHNQFDISRSFRQMVDVDMYVTYHNTVNNDEDMATVMMGGEEWSMDGQSWKFDGKLVRTKSNKGFALMMEDIDQPDHDGDGTYTSPYAESVSLIKNTWGDNGAKYPGQYTSIEDIAAVRKRGGDWNGTTVWLSSTTQLDREYAKKGLFYNTGPDVTDYKNDGWRTGFVAVTKSAHISFMWTGAHAGTEIGFPGGAPQTGWLAVQKTSDHPSWLHDSGKNAALSGYSIEGAKYGVYESKEAAEKGRESDAIAVLTTNDKGYAEVELVVGSSDTGMTFWVREIEPSSGHGLDKTGVFEVQVTKNCTHKKPALVESEDPALYESYDTLITKADPDYGYNDPSGDCSLGGWKFTLNVTDSTVMSKQVGQTVWATERSTDGKSGRLKLADGSPVSGKWYWQDADGNNVLPISTYTIKENAQQDEKGYFVNEETFSFDVTRKPDPVVTIAQLAKKGREDKDNKNQRYNYYAQISQTSNNWDRAKYSETYNTGWTVTEPNQYRNEIKVRKVDEDWHVAGDKVREIGPEGDGSFAGATFTCYNMSDHHVTVHGVNYEVGQAMPSKKIEDDENPVIVFDDLPYGTYLIKETEPPIWGYDGNDEWSLTVEVRHDKYRADDGSSWTSSSTVPANMKKVTEGGKTAMVYDYTSSEFACADPVWRGGLDLQKVDHHSWESEEGNGVLEGAVFNVYNISKHEVYSRKRDGATYPTYRDEWAANKAIPAGAVPVATITTDVEGKASLPVDTLPYGTYILREESAPEGYMIDEPFDRGVVFCIRWKGEIASFDYIDQDEKRHWYWNPGDAWDDEWGVRPNDMP